MDDYLKIMQTSYKITKDKGCNELNITTKTSYGYNGYYYSTYLAHKKVRGKLISSCNYEKFKPLDDNIQTIFKDKKFQHKIIKSFGLNKEIIEISYYDYKLIFGWVNKNIYLLNIIEEDDTYPQDERVAIYKMSDVDKNSFKEFALNDESYFAVNIGNSFIRFSDYHKGKFSELNRNYNFKFWEHFIKYLKGEKNGERFLYSQIGNLYIVYGYET